MKYFEVVEVAAGVDDDVTADLKMLTAIWRQNLVMTPNHRWWLWCQSMSLEWLFALKVISML